MESISWFKSYREIDGFYNEAVSLVAKKLDLSEAEAMDRIASQESEIVTIQSPEGNDFVLLTVHMASIWKSCFSANPISTCKTKKVKQGFTNYQPQAKSI